LNYIVCVRERRETEQEDLLIVVKILIFERVALVICFISPPDSQENSFISWLISDSEDLYKLVDRTPIDGVLIDCNQLITKKDEALLFHETGAKEILDKEPSSLVLVIIFADVES
jgi:hypothetical protein